MKKHSFLFFALIALCFCASCNEEMITAQEESAPEEFSATRSANLKGIENLDTVYFVTEKDVDAYIHFKKLLAENEKEEFAVLDVKPMKLDDEYTCAYIINYKDGWEIISADKRAPLVLASDKTGYYSTEEMPAEIQAWMTTLEADVLSIRVSSEFPEWADDETVERMEQAADFWLAINADNDYIESLGGDGFNPEPNPRLGHWEFERTMIQTTELEYVAPLIQTNFDQGTPYNNCCPYIHASYPVRTPAGCVAIAGAQMAYYLHNKIQKPELAPSSGYCNGYAYLNYNPLFPQSGIDTNAYQTIHVGTYNSTIWDTMISTPANASYLIAEIGKAVHMKYSAGGSGATLEMLRDACLYPTGLSSSLEAYVADTIISNIKRDLPVILGANAINGTDTVGHSFITDGYKKTQSQLVSIYEWIYDDPNAGPVSIVPERVIVETTYPIEEKIHMNWGWGASYNGNDAWYGLSGGWNGLGVNYNINRRMLYGFEITQ